jgi:hypothetical protein
VIKEQYSERLAEADAIEVAEIAPVVGAYERKIKKIILNRKRRANRKKWLPVQTAIDFNVPRETSPVKRAKQRKKRLKYKRHDRKR